MGLRWVVVVMADDEDDAKALAGVIERDIAGHPTTRVQQEAD